MFEGVFLPGHRDGIAKQAMTKGEAEPRVLRRLLRHRDELWSIKGPKVSQALVNVDVATETIQEHKVTRDGVIQATYCLSPASWTLRIQQDDLGDAWELRLVDRRDPEIHVSIVVDRGEMEALARLLSGILDETRGIDVWHTATALEAC